MGWQLTLNKKSLQNTSVFLLALAIVPRALSQAPPRTRPDDAAVHQRVDALLKQMTLDEKIGQLSQLFDFRPGTSHRRRCGERAARLAALCYRSRRNQPPPASSRRSHSSAHSAHLRLRCHPRLPHHLPRTYRHGCFLGSRCRHASPDHRRHGSPFRRHRLGVRADAGYRARSALGPHGRRRWRRSVISAPPWPRRRCAGFQGDYIGCARSPSCLHETFRRLWRCHRRPRLRRSLHSRNPALQRLPQAFSRRRQSRHRLRDERLSRI